jgi:hypothetical protein
MHDETVKFISTQLLEVIIVKQLLVVNQLVYKRRFVMCMNLLFFVYLKYEIVIARQKSILSALSIDLTCYIPYKLRTKSTLITL